MKYLFSGAVAALLVASVPHVVVAQDLASNFKRDKNVSVRERPRPDYEAIGVRAGGFTVYPRVTVELEHSDNIYATPVLEQSDTIWRVRPEVAVRSNWSRHALGAFASASINRYSDFDTENTEEYTVAVNGRVDIVRGSNVSGSLQYQALTEPRTSPSAPLASRTPVEYSLLTGKMTGIKEFNRLRLTGKLTNLDYDYDDTINLLGGLLEQDTRDRDEFIYGGKVEYAVSPDTALFVQVLGNTRSYDLTGVGRDSDGYTATIGTNFEISELLRGEIEVGYMAQSYDSPQYRDVDGFSGQAQVEWFPTSLSTVTATASRTIEESVANNSQGYISSNVGATVDHEFLRNVLLSAHANYGEDDYQSIDRVDERAEAGVSGTYLLNRRLGLTLGYTYEKRDSSGVNRGTSFTENKLAASVALQF